ncbi:MAG: amidase [Hyphomicrobiaceae bacterium]
MLDPIIGFDAIDLAAAFRSRALDPVECLDLCFARIGESDRTLNCFTALSERARLDAEASAARFRAGAPRGLLDGVPIAIKDNLVVEGMPATWGSRLFAGAAAPADEAPIARIRAQGAVIVGKTNTPEFSIEGYTANALFGVTGNAWQPDLTPGGSSGGSASAVAAGLVPIAIGTDGGGSIRRPAAYTGLFGLKPSVGRIPRAGGLPQLLRDFEVVGTLTRSVRDARALLGAMSPRGSPAHQGGDGLTSSTRTRQDLRILFVEAIDGSPCDPAILASVRLAAGRLAAMGHSVEVGSLPFEIAEFNALWPSIGASGLARLMADRPDFRTKVPETYVAIAEAGMRVSDADLAHIDELVRSLRTLAGEAFANIDLIVTPCCAAMPWAANVPFPDTIDGTPVGPRAHAIYTGWVNAIGHPAVSIPCDPAADGLPIGVQVVGPSGGDDLLLDIAARYEASHPWRYPWQADRT